MLPYIAIKDSSEFALSVSCSVKLKVLPYRLISDNIYADKDTSDRPILTTNQFIGRALTVTVKWIQALHC